MVFSNKSEKLEINSNGSIATVSDYFELLKPRVMSLAIFTAIIGLLLAPNNIHPFLAVFSIIAIGAGAGAAGAPEPLAGPGGDVASRLPAGPQPTRPGLPAVLEPLVHCANAGRQGLCWRRRRRGPEGGRRREAATAAAAAFAGHCGPYGQGGGGGGPLQGGRREPADSRERSRGSLHLLPDGGCPGKLTGAGREGGAHHARGDEDAEPGRSPPGRYDARLGICGRDAAASDHAHCACRDTLSAAAGHALLVCGDRRQAEDPAPGTGAPGRAARWGLSTRPRPRAAARLVTACLTHM